MGDIPWAKRGGLIYVVGMNEVGLYIYALVGMMNVNTFHEECRLGILLLLIDSQSLISAAVDMFRSHIYI